MAKFDVCMPAVAILTFSCSQSHLAQLSGQMYNQSKTVCLSVCVLTRTAQIITAKRSDL